MCAEPPCMQVLTDGLKRSRRSNSPPKSPTFAWVVTGLMQLRDDIGEGVSDAGDFPQWFCEGQEVLGRAVYALAR